VPHRPRRPTRATVTAASRASRSRRSSAFPCPLGRSAGVGARTARLVDTGQLDETIARAQRLAAKAPTRRRFGARRCLEHALAATGALLAEAEGDYAEAPERYADAAARWQRFGAVLEQAYALAGQSRCLVALGDPTVETPLREARALFSAMGARPRVEECDAILASALAAGA